MTTESVENSGKVSPTLVTLTSSSDSDFERSNVRTSASKKINLMALIRTLTILTATLERMKEKFPWFRQTEHVKHNSNPILPWLFGHSHPEEAVILLSDLQSTWYINRYD